MNARNIRVLDAQVLEHAFGWTLVPSSRELQTPERRGVHKLWEMAVLPLGRMAERFGAHRVRMVRLAREEAPMLRAYRPDARLDLGHDSDWETEEIESLAFAKSGTLECPGTRLQSFDQAAASLTTRLSVVGGGTFKRTIKLPHPLSDSRASLTLMRIDSTAHPPGDVVGSVRKRDASSPANLPGARCELLSPLTIAHPRSTLACRCFRPFSSAALTLRRLYRAGCERTTGERFLADGTTSRERQDN